MLRKLNELTIYKSEKVLLEFGGVRALYAKFQMHIELTEQVKVVLYGISLFMVLVQVARLESEQFRVKNTMA